MKKVLLVVDTLEVGGTEKSILALCSRFKSMEPVVVHLFKGDTLKRQFQQAGVKVISLNLRSPFLVLNCFTELKNVIKAEQPAVVMASLFFAEFYTRLSLLGSGVPLVGTFVNDSYSQDRFRKLSISVRIKLRVYQLLDALTARRCNFFLANSQTIAASNSKALGLGKRKIDVIYRGRDISLFQKEYEPNQKRLHFVTVGRLIKRKGHEELIRVFGKLIKKFPQAQLSIAGDGDERVPLQLLIETLSLQDHVELLGQVNNIPALLYAADFFVFTSHYEGFSGALIEAMMVGIPVVASDIAMTREAITHKQEGYLYACGQEQDLLSAIEYVIGHRHEVIAMAIRARVKAREVFDIEHVAADTERYLLNIVNKL